MKPDAKAVLGHICVVVATIFTVLAFVGLIAPGSLAQSGEGDDVLTGEALAKSLGLKLLPAMPDDCAAYVEVADPAGYCIDHL